ncbi:hypothetical protein [Streptomyces fradiae]|uniref:hypothetical protein n=1 Tax=Streptomyces fradiae TaxID=1906 RepID=UPI0035BE1626
MRAREPWDDFGPDGDGGFDDLYRGSRRIDARANNRSTVTVAGRDVRTTYFVSVSSAALAAVVGLVALLGVWQPWDETDPTGERDGAPAATATEYTGGGHTARAAPYRKPTPTEPTGGGSGEDPEEPDPTPTSDPPDPPEPSAPPDPVDVAFASVRVGTCLSVYDDGWGRLSQDRPVAVDCGAGFAFTKVTMVTTLASHCPSGAGQYGWGHVNGDGSSVALCLDRVFAAGQCFPATLTRQADGTLGGEARLFSVWGCDRKQVPKGMNAKLVITAVQRGGTCPQRADRQTLQWRVFNGSATVCAVQTQ